mmetsp:Transcript_33341/g.76184  ORF Transcript_33341/g.76184 Transcript_33341/m.76184 type:complete len:209 (-) Transcript_33341:276-902(-)
MGGAVECLPFDPETLRLARTLLCSDAAARRLHALFDRLRSLGVVAAVATVPCRETPALPPVPEGEVAQRVHCAGVAGRSLQGQFELWQVLPEADCAGVRRAEQRASVPGDLTHGRVVTAVVGAQLRLWTAQVDLRSDPFALPTGMLHAELLAECRFDTPQAQPDLSAAGRSALVARAVLAALRARPVQGAIEPLAGDAAVVVAQSQLR